MDTTIASPNHTSSITYRILGAALAGAGLLLAAASMSPAFAGTPAQAQAQAQAKVAYADLDLSTKAGARALLSRIDVAANEACGKQIHSPLLPRESAFHRECVNDAVSNAVQRIGSPLVTALNGETQAQASVSLAAR